MTLSRNPAHPRDVLFELQRSLVKKLDPYVEPVNAAIIASLAFLYFAVGKFVQRPATPNHSVTAIWLPAGISLAAVLLRGNRVWPGVFLGTFLLSVNITGTIGLSFGFGLGNTLEALLAAHLIHKSARGIHAFFRTADVLRFIFFAGVLAPALCATIGTSLLCLGGRARLNDFFTLWFVWWVGDMLGTLFLTPFLVLLFAHKHHSPGLVERLEIAALIAGLSVMCVLNFGERPMSWIPGNGFLFLCAPFLAWAAIRFCPLEAAGAILVMGGLATWGSLHGLGPFENPTGLPLFVGAFMALGTAITLTIAAASAEQKSATKDVLGMYCILKDTKEGEIRVLQDTVEALQVELARNGARAVGGASQNGVQ
jgi:integral membrane sensor domain MASE1